MNQLTQNDTAMDSEIISDMFPSAEIMRRLALNDSGFVFDPVNGRSFSANAVGLYVLRFLQHSSNANALLDAIEGDFEVTRAVAQRDIADFSGQLRKFLS